jgi:hypothetical protein
VLRTHQRLGEEADGAKEERGSQDLGRDGVDAVPVAVLKRSRKGDAEEGRGGAAEEHPAGEPGVHVPESAVADRSDGLEDRPVRDVGADRDRGAEAEQEHEDRSHERPSSHPDHSDHRAHEQSREDELPARAALG